MRSVPSGSTTLIRSTSISPNFCREFCGANPATATATNASARNAE
jgi:hypothetical protein